MLAVVFPMQVKNQNLSAYKRIRDLISNTSKRFYVFANEHHNETFIKRESSESSNDRNDRAIRVATKWYSKHLKESVKKPPKIVLLTNDRENSEKAKLEDIEVFTIHNYASSLIEHPSLVDRLAKSTFEDGTKSKERVIFPEHLPLSAIQTGLKKGKYHQGVFHSSRENYLEGSVSISSIEKFVLVQGLENLNRSVDEDVVAIELFPKEKWSSPSGYVMKDADSDEQLDGEESEKTVTNLPKSSEKIDETLLQPTGRVLGVIKRNWRPYCGTILPLTHSAMSSTRMHTFIPANRRIPRVRLETRQAKNLVGKRIVVSIDSWPRTSRFPRGHYVRELGEIGDKDTENEVLLIEHDVPHLAFSQAVLADLPQLPWSITNKDLEIREDLRHLDICSVDPPGCTDIDDALHCKQLDEGNFEVGVHIADVSHFIRPGTALDKEAENRGTTVYLTDKRIDMVPDLLSSNLCSLRGGEERYAFSTIWKLTPNAKIVSKRFIKSVIRSRAALTYAEAQMRIDDASLVDPVTESLRRLNILAKILKKKRLEAGALTLASPEIRFEVDSETHDPIDLQTKELRDTNSLVEEFMLLANTTVAKHIYETFPTSAVLRRHPSPPLSNYDILIKAGKSKGVEIAVETAKALATSLDKASLPQEPYFNTMLRIMTTRCMMQALYFCSGTLPEEEYKHYGLATLIYTHFTSPIRRYSDLLVHRLLAVSIQVDSTYPELLDKHIIQQVCNHLNHRHKNAQYAARASVNLHTHLFFKNKTTVEESFVLFVRHNALHLLIPKYGLESPLFFDDKSTSDGKKLSMVSDDSEPSLTIEGVKFRLFDRVLVQVTVEKSSIQQSKLKLTLVSPKIPGYFDMDDSDTLPPPSKKIKPNF